MNANNIKPMKILSKLIIIGLSVMLMQASAPDPTHSGSSYSYCIHEIPFLPVGYCRNAPGGKYCFIQPNHFLDEKDCTATLYPL